MLKLAIIGAGWAGLRQIAAARELGAKVSIECLVDHDEVFLHSKAQELNVAKTFTDYQAALNDSEIDAVSICTPHPLHCSMSLAAAAAGKHIMVEKPMAMTVREATMMIAAAEKYGVKLFVAEQLPYMPMSELLRDEVETGRHIGEFITATYSSGFRAQDFGYAGRRAWLTNPEEGGTGTWMLHGIHSMAQLRYIFGEVTTVYLQEHKAQSFVRRQLEGTMSGLLTLERGGHIAVVQTSEVNLNHDLGGYIIHGDRGTIRAVHDGYTIYSSEKDVKAQEFAYPEASLSEYAREMNAFAEYVTDSVPVPTTGYSERRSLAIIEAGYESAANNRLVHLLEHFGAL